MNIELACEFRTAIDQWTTQNKRIGLLIEANEVIEVIPTCKCIAALTITAPHLYVPCNDGDG